MGSIALQIGILALVATCAFAWSKGGAAERWGSGVVAVIWIGSLALQALTSESLHSTNMLIGDFLLAIALLVLAIRYSSLWLGTAMLLQGLVLALHAEALGETGLIAPYYYIAAQNAVSYLQLLTIAGSTLAAWLLRRRRVDAAAHAVSLSASTHA